MGSEVLEERLKFYSFAACVADDFRSDPWIISNYWDGHWKRHLTPRLVLT
jgi:hypothetical protein